ncbi:MAG: PhoH family protein [Bacteroidota bacterium]|nr:PhoH family protein [Bacteroidota bacterium]
MIKKIISLRPESIDSFFGVNSNLLKKLQQRHKNVRVVSRGEQIVLMGEKEKIEMAEKELSKMINLYDEEKDGMRTNKKRDVVLFAPAGKVVKARTENQQSLVDLIQKKDIDFALGPAGTGKTFLSVAMAVKALKEKEIKRIIFARPAVEAGENLGFLPGDLKEKIDPYLRPIYDSLRDLLPQDKYLKYIEDGIIEIAPMAFMRGRTLNNCYVVLDEAQNATEGQIKMFLTRMGPNAKFIITGDATQIDLPKNQKSGLLDAVNKLKSIHGIGVIELSEVDVVRHKLVKEIIRAYQGAHPS